MTNFAGSSAGTIGSAGTSSALLERIESFTNFQRRLSGFLHDIGQATDLNSVFSQKILDTGAVHGRALEEVSGELDRIGQSSRQVLADLEESGAAIEGSRNCAVSSASLMEKAISSIDSMEETFKRVAQLFVSVRAEAKSILEQIANIVDISELTNLLALNAAIQAARAGEHGKGFAVVAKEVRSLAERTKHITDELSRRVAALQSSLESSSASLEQYQEIKAGVVTDVRRSAEQLGATSESLASASARVSRIRDLSSEQAASVGLIVSRVGKLAVDEGFMNSSSRHITASMATEKALLEGLGRHLEATIGEWEAAAAAFGQDGQAKGKGLRIGHDIAYPPWVCLRDGVSSGVSVDLMQRVCSKAGIAPIFVGDQWDRIQRAFERGAIDVVINAGWPNTAFREGTVLPTIPYARFAVKVFVRSSARGASGELDLAALRGKRIAVQSGSYVDQVVKDSGCELVYIENDIHGMVQLIWEEVDGVATEDKVGEYFSKEFFGGSIVGASEVLGSKDVVMLVGAGSAALRDELNEAIRSLGSMS